MAGPTDVLTAIQNGVTALNNLGKQVSGSFTNIASQLAATAPSSGVVTTIAGNSGAFTLNSTSGITNTVNDIKLSQASSSQFGAVKVDGTTITAVAGVISVVGSRLTASTSADIALNNTANYFDGPSVAQGSSGTWFASGSVTVGDTAAANRILCKLWDGTTVIDSGPGVNFNAGNFTTISLSGFLTAPASNMKISCRCDTATTGVIKFNFTGNSKDSTITAIRIG